MHRRPDVSLGPRGRLSAGLVLLAVSLFTSGFSSCAGTTGPLFAPLVITPSEVLVRASIAAGTEAIALARVDGGESSDRYSATIEYGKRPEVPWLTIEVAGRNLTLFASTTSLEPGVYEATVIIEGESSGASGSMRVEFIVNP